MSLQVERSALRTKVKALKDLVVSGGFMASKIHPQATPPSDPLVSILKAGSMDVKEDSISSVQDGLADLKRAITEVVECWNIL